MRESTRGTLLVLGAAAGFGTIGIFGELAAAVGLPLRTLLPVRFTLATAALLAVGWARGWRFVGDRRGWLAAIGLGVVYTGMTLFYFVSLRSLTAGLATIVLYTYPAMVLGLSAALLGESVTARKLLALALAGAGVGLVVGTDVSGAAPIGIGLALGAAACYALYTAGSRSLVTAMPPRSLMLGVLLGTTGSMLGYGVLAGGLSLPVEPAGWGVVLGLTALGTVIPLLLFYEGVARLSASRVGIVSTAEPLTTVVLGVALLGEPVTLALLIGGALILAGVLLAQGRDAGGAGRLPPPDEAP